VWPAAQIPVDRHENARRAEAALQRVIATEGLLQHRKPAGLGREPLDRVDACAIRLHREREAGARGRAVDLNGASAAGAVLAADMRAGKSELVAQEIREQHARLGLAFDGAA